MIRFATLLLAAGSMILSSCTCPAKKDCATCDAKAKECCSKGGACCEAGHKH